MDLEMMITANQNIKSNISVPATVSPADNYKSIFLSELKITKVKRSFIHDDMYMCFLIQNDKVRVQCFQAFYSLEAGVIVIIIKQFDCSSTVRKSGFEMVKL